MPKTAVIVGAGPAGLAAAFELLERTDVVPVVLEASDHLGGIARTVEYRGNRIDIGGHRFFSKSDRVMDWWQRFLPLQALPPGTRITYQNSSRALSACDGPDPEREDRVMLLRPRRSRIYHRRQLFDYPISLSPDTVRKLGVLRTFRIGLSYLRAALFPIRPEENLEQFFINRFGRELYGTFFKDYTEKVWGVPCEGISAAWGAQRVKGLSITKAVMHFVRTALRGRGDVAQKGTETSLIEQFLYPKLGPGQMWQEVAAAVRARGGQVLMGRRAVRIEREGTSGEAAAPGDDRGRVKAVVTRDVATGAEERLPADWVFSSMPIRDLVAALEPPPPPAVAALAEGLVYRDFITVGLLLDGLKLREKDGAPLRDNWIYVQEPDVKVGRLQIFNNWSPWLVADPTTTWVGLEYFCDEGDELWSLSDEALVALGVEELVRIGLAEPGAVRDGVVLRMPKTYPAYLGTYDRFPELRAWLDGIANLFLVGRNGMHRYNNQDHSILTAMVAVDNILAGHTDKANLWEVNTEEEYHEERPTE